MQLPECTEDYNQSPVVGARSCCKLPDEGSANEPLVLWKSNWYSPPLKYSLAPHTVSDLLFQKYTGFSGN